MAIAKKLGIWMDHANAHLMEFTSDPIVTKTIELKPAIEEKEYGFGRNEIMMHNKEQRQQSDYYKQLGKVIMKYEHVLLFGPTEAKVELLNSLVKKWGIGKTKIEVKHTDKMTENQQHAFVRKYFDMTKKKWSKINNGPVKMYHRIITC